MSKFDVSFASKLADLANTAIDESSSKYANLRAAVYPSRVACEIACKALLEAAGMPVAQIEQRRHDIPVILRDLLTCEVNLDPYGEPNWVSADVVAEQTVTLSSLHIPILELIGAAGAGFSKFPNEIRYGETVMDVSPSLLADAARKFCAWAELFCWRIRLPSQSDQSPAFE